MRAYKPNRGIPATKVEAILEFCYGRVVVPIIVLGSGIWYGVTDIKMFLLFALVAWVIDITMVGLRSGFLRKERYKRFFGDISRKRSLKARAQAFEKVRSTRS